MKKNMGSVDKIIRFILGAIIVALYFMNIISGVLGILLLVVAAVIVLTSFANFCPIYALFKIKTSKSEE